MRKNLCFQYYLIVIAFVFLNAGTINAAYVPFGVNVLEFGAKGDGITDDTKAIIMAINKAGDGIVEFPRGTFRITKTIEIVLTKSGPIGLSGKGGSASIIMEGEGPAFRFTGSHNGSASPESVTNVTWKNERMPLVEGLEIVGKNPKSNGLEFRHTLMPVIRGMLIRDVHNGIHLVSRSRNVIIANCHIYNCSGVGIYLDSVNLHQIIIGNSHISYCKLGGIVVSRSEIRNFQITGNDIEYNCDPEGPVSADIWIDCSQRGSVREGSISGNTIQAIPSPGGANIRFTGSERNAEQIGLWSITGNHISNHTVNIHLYQTRGISISGNTFIRGYDKHMIIENSSNVVINANVYDHNSDYFTKGINAPGGISVFRSQNLIFSDNILDGVESGSDEIGGAFTITDCNGMAIRGCYIINPKFRGIHVINCKNVRISDCVISEQKNIPVMSAGIELTGKCYGTIVKNNSIRKGRKGVILNQASGAVIDDNISIEE